MTKQTFSIDGAWDVELFYDVRPRDLHDVVDMMREEGATAEQIEEAWKNLQGWNAGVTFSSFINRKSLVFIGRAENALQFFNTIDHENDHVHAHVAMYYDVELGTEEAAYLQGFIGGRVFGFVFNQLKLIEA